MGQCCAKCFVNQKELELSKQIESSYSVKKTGCCSRTEKYVQRDAETNGKYYPSMDLLFDDIDSALSAWTSYPLIFNILFGLIGTPLLAIFGKSMWIWAVWVLPNICLVQPKYWKRCRTLRNALEKWNRDFGSKVGVVACLGIQDSASFKLFLLAMYPRLGCQKNNPKVHFCQGGSDNRMNIFRQT